LITAVEQYVGTPYMWGIYQLLILPPSMPFGGMENPLMNFISPTVVTGTKSQVYVVIHEMAHSWTGDQVTMNNWEDFWLNEGYTTFIERQVSSRLYGGDFAKVEALLGNTSLVNTANSYGWDNTYSSIHPVLFGDNPDNSFSEMPYEKGYQLLQYINNYIGGTAFQKYLAYYINNNSWQSITSYDQQRAFSNFVQSYFPEPETINTFLENIPWNEWRFMVGPDPSGTLNFTTTNSVRAEQLALDYIALNGTASPPNYKQYNSWYSNLKVVFQNTL
jgi:leukotriene-A4 hydrolase